jgi:glucose/arabinose dehydrogenase
MKRIFYPLALLLCFPLFTLGQTINLQQVIGAGISSPIGAYFAPGNDSIMYIIQQTGRIKTANVNTGVVSGTDFLNVTSKITSSGNEQGLLGMAFHPDYANNGYFFINYTKASGGATVVARYKRNASDPFTADLASEDIVIQIAQPFSNHNGGQIQFGRDGYLYIGMGDGGSANDPQGNGQNGQALLAKMLRLDIDVDSGYAIPSTNPFLNDAGKRDEIWSMGLRNPWRFSFDMKTADMWIADVGQNVWEEIDFEPANTGGLNYGWRCYEGNVAFNTSGCAGVSSYTPPVFVYNHSGGNCSVTGGFVYRGGTYGELYGKYIFTDYCSGKFWTMEPDGLGGWTTDIVTTTPVLTFQITSFAQDGKGEMYVVSREGNKIYKITGTICAAADIYSPTGTLESCTGSLQLNAPYSSGNSYVWYRNDTLLSETSSTLNATISGIYKVEVENISNSCGGEAVAEVIVNQESTVEITWTTPLLLQPMCLDEEINLSALPAGGIFSGNGVVDSTFSSSDAGPGIHTLVYTFTDENGCSVSEDSPEITVADCYSSINEFGVNEIKVFPNPFTHEVQIPLDGEKNITILGMDGKLVFRSKQTANYISLGFMANGTYLLVVEHNGNVYRQNIVKGK